MGWGMEMLRRILSGSDARKAREYDQQLHRQIRDAAHTDLTAFRRDLEAPNGKVGQGYIPLGRCQDQQGQWFWVGLPAEELAQSRGWVVGASGSGKSVWLLSIIIAHLQEPNSGALVVCDMKGELASWLTDIWLPLLADQKQGEDRKSLLERIVIISPFGRFLPELNVTRRNQQIPIELQAFDVANTIGECFGSQGQIGPRMDTILKFLVKLACEFEIPLPEIRELLTGSSRLAELVSRSRDQDLREYFALRFPHEPAAAIFAVSSRLDNLFLLPDNRWILAGEGMVDFSQLLERQAIVILNLGDPPLGLEPLAKWWGAFLLTKLARAIMSRPVNVDTRGALVVLDEFQVALTATQADNFFERLMTQARFKRVALLCACQQVSQVAKVSPALVSILSTNATLLACFRSDEARHLEQALPVTGLQPRIEPGFPSFNDEARYLNPSEERREALVNISRLPQRYFYLYLKGRHQEAQLLRTGTVDLEGARKQLEQVPPELVEQVQRGVNGKSRQELREGLQRRERREGGSRPAPTGVEASQGSPGASQGRPGEDTSKGQKVVSLVRKREGHPAPQGQGQKTTQRPSKEGRKTEGSRKSWPHLG